MIKTKNLFISGKPGSGKTTLIREACLRCRNDVGGFYTEEMREGSERRGFMLKTFDGQSRVMAEKGLRTSHRLNKYGIDLAAIEEVGVEALKKALDEKPLIVIDEIGSMEMISEVFREMLFECLNSPKRVLATIRFNAQPFTDEVKKMDNTSVVIITRENFARVKQQTIEWIEETQ